MFPLFYCASHNTFIDSDIFLFLFFCSRLNSHSSSQSLYCCTRKKGLLLFFCSLNSKINFTFPHRTFLLFLLSTFTLFYRFTITRIFYAFVTQKDFFTMNLFIYHWIHDYKNYFKQKSGFVEYDMQLMTWEILGIENSNILIVNCTTK